MIRRFDTVGARFALGFAVVVLVALLVTHSEGKRRQGMFEDLASAQLRAWTVERAADVARMIEANEQQMRVHAGSALLQPEGGGGNIPGLRRLAQIRKELPHFEALCVLDNRGGFLMGHGDGCPMARRGLRIFLQDGQLMMDVGVPLASGEGILASRARLEIADTLLADVAVAGVRAQARFLDASAEPGAGKAEGGLLKHRAHVGDYPLWIESRLPRAELAATWQSSMWALAAELAVALVVFTLMLVGLLRSLRVPLRRVVETTESLAAGRFDVRVPEVGPKEVRQVARSANRMAESLQRLYGNLEAEVQRRTHEYLVTLGHAQELQRLAQAQAEELQAQNEELQAQASELALHQHTLFHQYELLAEKNRELELASRMKSEFVANMSHELRTPLNAVIGFSELLDQGYGGALSEEQREYVADIHRAGRHLLSMINDILDLAKLEAGKMNLAQESVPLSLPLREAEQMVRALASRKGLRFAVELDPTVSVAGDRTRLRQVALNLLSNALKFTPSGGQVKAWVRPSADGRWAELGVSDTGIGISPEHHEHIFEAFRQVDGSVTRNFEGTGLGLSLVKRFVTAMDGRVEVQSREGEGATFVVRFPRADSEEVAAPEAPPEHQAATLRVLVAEDDGPVRELVRKLISSRGHEVEVAYDGADAVEKLQASLPDVLVLDLMMPRLDGFEVLERLRQMPGGERVAVMVLSAKDPWGSEADRLKSLRAEWALKGSMQSAQFVARVVGLGAQKAAARAA